MFYNGKIYRVKKANAAVQAAVKEYLAKELTAIDDPLEQYDRAQEVLHSRPLVSWLAKHLIPNLDFEVTDENAAIVAKAVWISQTDPSRAHVLETRDARRWAATQEAEHGAT